MKHFAHFNGEWAVVGVGFHDVGHMRPPASADLGLRDGGPARFVLDFDLSEETAALFIQKNRVVVRAMLFENGFQRGPDGGMATLIFVFVAWFEGHNEGFANHESSFWG